MGFFFFKLFVTHSSHFSNWIFNGVIQDQGRELFIESMDYYMSKTKFFFDKGFVLKRQSVPGFLQGWEDAILLCGKYSNLLKLYNPMVSDYCHALFIVFGNGSPRPL